MYWFKKRECAEEAQPTEQQISFESVSYTALKDSSDITQDEIKDAYWMSGNPNSWNYSLWMLLANQYQFGTAVCKGTIHRTLKNCGYGYELVHQEPFGEISIISDGTVFEAAKNVFCWIDTMEEWRSITDNRYYYDVFIPKKIAGMLDGKYSEPFSILLASRSTHSRDLIQKAVTLYEEGLSPDMRAYLLLTDVQK